MKLLHKKEGFSLVETIVAVAVFVIFALGIYGAINSVLNIARESRIKVALAGVLSQQMEIIRSVPYDKVGVINGNPNGVLAPSETVDDEGMVFLVTTSVILVDDPFDGTATSTPPDTNPADYKLVSVAVSCTSCASQSAVMGQTEVAPPIIEGTPETGSLLIHVVDSMGQPVPGANVSIVNNNVTPLVNTAGLTDGGGWYTLLNAATSTLGYYIMTTLSGYSTDYTVASSTNNPSPTKLPASVSVGQVTTISFAIDLLGTLNVHTVNSACTGLGNETFSMNGQKLLGSLPVVYKYLKNLSTDGSGNKTVSNLEWDNYAINLTDNNFDVAGTTPLLPVSLLPGATQDVTMLLSSHTANTLLVVVKDAVTGLPLSGATVELSKTGYEQSIYTGEGFVGQTDWSQGSGQTNFTNVHKYYVDNGSLDVTSVPGNVTLKSVSHNTYLTSGWLESSTFDAGTSNITYANLQINPSSQSSKLGDAPLSFQLATSNSSSPAAWNWLGPDGTGNTFYSATSTVIANVNNGNRYLRYRAFFSSANNKYTPTLSDFYYTYSSNCTPPGQAFFSNLSTGNFSITISKPLYQQNSGTVTVGGNGQILVNLSPL